MLLDTHCHLTTIQSREVDLSELFFEIAKQDFSFVLDIGTHCDDIQVRKNAVKQAISKIQDTDIQKKLEKTIFYTAGIWPAPEAIENPVYEIETLKKSVEQNPDILAIGECGLDHHWNVTNGVASGADFRDEAIFSPDFLIKECDFFKMQIELAKEKKLPIVVHSRDAFEETLQCIKDCGYHNGVIHCFSYNKEQAAAFLDLGWYIALGGAVTYCKKSKIEQMNELINFIPKNRLLLETDAPYLAPVPFRGQTNTPLLINNTYEFIANSLCMRREKLEEIVFENTKTLFFSKKGL